MRGYILSFMGGLIVLCVTAWSIVAFEEHLEVKDPPLYTFSTVFRTTVALLMVA